MMYAKVRSARGSASLPVLVLTLLCATITSALLVTQHAVHEEVENRLDVERAFQLAEAGAAYMTAEIRENDGALPAQLVQTRSPHTSGSFTVRVVSGDMNGRDDDGDGDVDEADEEPYRVIVSTGTSGDQSRSVEVTLRQEVDVPGFESGLAMNSEFPNVTLDGAAFRVNGNDHDLGGTGTPSLPSEYALTTIGDPAYVQAQIDSQHTNQFQGTGSNPSVGSTTSVDLDLLMSLAAASADMELVPGTISQLVAGTPTQDGMVTVYCPGNLTLSGGAEGAGLLAVDGDLDITGGLQWTGIVLVRGTVRFTGGGGNDRIVGSMVVGGDATLTGTIDLLYSSEAIGMARLRLLYLGVVAWREVANP